MPKISICHVRIFFKVGDDRIEKSSRVKNFIEKHLKISNFLIPYDSYSCQKSLYYVFFCIKNLFISSPITFRTFCLLCTLCAATKMFLESGAFQSKFKVYQKSQVFATFITCRHYRNFLFMVKLYVIHFFELFSQNNHQKMHKKIT